MSFGGNKNRAMTPKGQMSGSGSGPAIMMMPPHIRATFLPNPPIKHLPSFRRHVLQSDNYITEDEEDDEQQQQQPRSKAKGPSGVSFIPHSFPRNKKRTGLAGVASYLSHFERTAPPPRVIHPTPRSLKEAKRKSSITKHQEELKPHIERYRDEQKKSGGEHPKSGMNCYNTLFVGRLAYEVTERKLLREFEQFGPVKDLTIVTDPTDKKSRGYAFVEYEHEEDMKRAYRSADGMRLEGRHIVVDVERGHTVPNWLPRRLGGGLGGSRLGGKEVNVFYPGRFDPAKKLEPMPGGMGGGGGPMGMVMPPPPHFNGPPPGYRFDERPPPPVYGGRFDDRGGPPPPRRFDDRGPPPPMDRRGGPGMWERGGGGGGGYHDDRKRRRSRSPDRGDRRRGRY